MPRRKPEDIPKGLRNGHRHLMPIYKPSPPLGAPAQPTYPASPAIDRRHDGVRDIATEVLVLWRRTHAMPEGRPRGAGGKGE